MNLPRILLFFVVLSFSNCASQQSKLLSKKIADFSPDSFYQKITLQKDGKVKFIERFSYMETVEISAISYLSDDLKINGFLVEPKRNGEYPVIIFNRGGNRDFGELEAWSVLKIMGFLASKGYVVLGSQYREGGGSEGNDEFGGDDVNDILNLIDIIPEIEKADPERIGMYGWSRGGMMTYLALTRTDKISVAAVGGAPSDLSTSFKYRPEMEAGVYSQLIPNWSTNRKEEIEKRSAIYWADKFPKNVPLLMLHGNSDWRVRSEHSLKLALEFDKHRIPYRLVIFEGGSHGIHEHMVEKNNMVVEWFDKYFKKDYPLPDMEYHGN